MYADKGGIAHFPRQAGHDVGGVGPSNAYGQHSKAAGVGGMGVGAEDEAAGKCVVLQHHLVDDAATGLPEAHAVLAAG